MAEHLLVILLVVLLLAGFLPMGGTDVRVSRVFYGAGPFGGVALILLIIIVLLLFGRL